MIKLIFGLTLFRTQLVILGIYINPNECYSSLEKKNVKINSAF